MRLANYRQWLSISWFLTARFFSCYYALIFLEIWLQSLAREPLLASWLGLLIRISVPFLLMPLLWRQMLMREFRWGRLAIRSGDGAVCSALELCYARLLLIVWRVSWRILLLLLPVNLLLSVSSGIAANSVSSPIMFPITVFIFPYALAWSLRKPIGPYSLRLEFISKEKEGLARRTVRLPSGTVFIEETDPKNPVITDWESVPTMKDTLKEEQRQQATSLMQQQAKAAQAPHEEETE